MCHLCVLRLVFRLSFSPHAVSHPEMSPSLVCLENSYAYSKARLLNVASLWCSLTLPNRLWVLSCLRELYIFTCATLVSFVLKQTCPLETRGSVRSERQPVFGGAPSPWGGCHTGPHPASAVRETRTEGESTTAPLSLTRRQDGACSPSTQSEVGLAEEGQEEAFLGEL